MPDDDGSLVRMAASGHGGAFSDLLRRHGQVIHAYLARRGGRDAADDLLSEVFLRAYAARRKYDQRWPDARPWLYGIARNVLREYWRKASVADLGGSQVGQPPASDDPWPEVDARLDAAAQVSDLRRALSKLAPGDREVLLLVTWEGLTPAEVAVALGIPAGTARSRLHRARAGMRLSLDEGSAARAAANYQEA
jgi:RNA polymerase sigma factor (sigma-70 family)